MADATLVGRGGLAPYMHDGRAATLEQAIEMHAGQAAQSADRYRRLSDTDRAAVIAFLKSLRAP